MLAKALYITKDITFVTEQQGSWADETPNTKSPTCPTGDLAILLDRLSRNALASGLQEMTVILDHDAARAHGFPDRLPEDRDKCVRHPTMLRAREHGWRCSRLRAWMTFQRDKSATIHIGLGYWRHVSSAHENPLWDNDPGAATYLLWRFQNICGIAYHASPGVIGSQMLTRLYPNNSVTWHPEYGPGPRDALRQLTDTRYDFVNRDLVNQLTSGYVHVFDTNKAYLAGAGACDLARIPLTHTGLTAPFNPTISGIWRVVVPPWNDNRLPHPMGSNRAPGDDVWVTTPTLALVHQIAGVGMITFPRILDSYTAPPFTRNKKRMPGTVRVLREWAAHINVCLARCTEEPNELERDKLINTFKACYQRSINGIWKTSSSQIFREDWYYSADALTGANLYRKAWDDMNAGGPTPMCMSDVDYVHYASDKDNPNDIGLKKFVIGDALGEFTVKTFTADAWHGEFR